MGNVIGKQFKLDPQMVSTAVLGDVFQFKAAEQKGLDSLACSNVNLQMAISATGQWVVRPGVALRLAQLLEELGSPVWVTVLASKEGGWTGDASIAPRYVARFQWAFWKDYAKEFPHVNPVEVGMVSSAAAFQRDEVERMVATYILDSGLDPSSPDCLGEDELESLLDALQALDDAIDAHTLRGAEV